MGEQQGSFGPDGHLYSRKGIGTTLAALPLYWLGDPGRAGGQRPGGDADQRRSDRPDRRAGLPDPAPPEVWRRGFAGRGAGLWAGDDGLALRPLPVQRAAGRTGADGQRLFPAPLPRPRGRVEPAAGRGRAGAGAAGPAEQRHRRAVPGANPAGRDLSPAQAQLAPMGRAGAPVRTAGAGRAGSDRLVQLAPLRQPADHRLPARRALCRSLFRGAVRADPQPRQGPVVVHPPLVRGAGRLAGLFQAPSLRGAAGGGRGGSQRRLLRAVVPVVGRAWLGTALSGDDPALCRPAPGRGAGGRETPAGWWRWGSPWWRR